MALARWQATITDAQGNVLPGALVEVRSEVTGGLMPLFSDRPGLTPKANPFAADVEGYAFCHIAGGAYRIRAFDPTGSFERVWRYVAVGINAETDFSFGRAAGAWNDTSEYFEADLVSHSDGIGGPLYLFVSRIAGNIDNEPDVTTPGDTEEWMFVGAAAAGPPGAGDRLDIPVFIQGRPRAGELFPRIDMAADAVILDGACRATCAVAANQERVFTVTVNGDPIMTITFPSGETFGVYAVAGSLSLSQFDILAVTAPPQQDATLSDVSLTLVAERTTP